MSIPEGQNFAFYTACQINVNRKWTNGNSVGPHIAQACWVHKEKGDSQRCLPVSSIMQ